MLLPAFIDLENSTCIPSSVWNLFISSKMILKAIGSEGVILTITPSVSPTNFLVQTMQAPISTESIIPSKYLK